MRHCERNFIERYWCRARQYTRENCGTNSGVLKGIVAESVAEVCSACIHGFYGLLLCAIDAYSAGVQYGTEGFKQKVYKSHHNISFEGSKTRGAMTYPHRLNIQRIEKKIQNALKQSSYKSKDESSVWGKIRNIDTVNRDPEERMNSRAGKE